MPASLVWRNELSSCYDDCRITTLGAAPGLTNPIQLLRRPMSTSVAPGNDEYRRAADLRAALRRFHKESERVTRAHGLTPQRYELLLMIKTAADGREGAALSELADRLRLAQSTTTELVHRAEDAGLVRRELSPTKRGAVEFRLTKEGGRRLAGAFRELRAERRRLTSLLAALDAERGR